MLKSNAIEIVEKRNSEKIIVKFFDNFCFRQTLMVLKKNCKENLNYELNLLQKEVKTETGIGNLI